MNNYFDRTNHIKHNKSPELTIIDQHELYQVLAQQASRLSVWRCQLDHFLAPQINKSLHISASSMSEPPPAMLAKDVPDPRNLPEEGVWSVVQGD